MSDNDDVSKQETPEENEPLTMEQMGDLLESNLNIDFPKAGEIRDGIIASIGDNQILVSVGAKSEGIISGKEYESIPADFLLTMAVGQAIPVYVVTPEDQNGNLVLSFIRAVEEQSWLDAEEMKASGVSFESEIVGYNKGGLLVPLSTIRGFIPASQLSLSRRSEITGETPEEKYKAMIGEKVQCCVIEVDRERHRLILSERAASTETRDMVREKILDSLKEGDVRTGRVTSLADFGAFVNIGGADGLVHVSEISYDRITHPSEALKVGDEVKVKIISIDKERRRIGLSIRQLQNDPWSTQVNALKVGQLVEGEITRLTNFGAFAKLNIPGDMEGLIHISELSDKRVDHPKEILKVGDRVALRILRIEEENRRIGLSMRRVDSPQYADQDWKSLAQDLDVVSSSSGEALGDIVGEISQSVSAAAPEESAPAEESPVEAAPEENAPVEESPAEETPSAEEPQA
ncbi:MAG TPA: S1 RNA-binding domain-containing protein [Anaerolineaceae bacterium]|jgi:small subunit ribosomal protein S1|nr:S1 RNA-binding domain-containing protein [Anaerolineales bacterium]HOG58786.1 S1 RNA-binding domain-containing protein [Anaerolineaceae bacterium]HOR83356.1 S1 RNA-binding domain-containing protein [Anaerolineaceae bacterium]HOT53147.1 S1 RNA-binding domain-containing protein [Anaerolineaceae bacterium]HPL42940.1 S1 RNA-binding domain-containing protein [Anaerolineaceae bacterium]